MLRCHSLRKGGIPHAIETSQEVRAKDPSTSSSPGRHSILSSLATRDRCGPAPACAGCAPESKLVPTRIAQNEVRYATPWSPSTESGGAYGENGEAGPPRVLPSSRGATRSRGSCVRASSLPVRGWCLAARRPRISPGGLPPSRRRLLAGFEHQVVIAIEAPCAPPSPAGEACRRRTRAGTAYEREDCPPRVGTYRHPSS